MLPAGAIVWVLGATGGIGSATARLLHAQGARLALSARRAEPLEALAAELGALALPLDHLDAEALKGAVARIQAEWGEGPWGLVHAVGSILLRPAHLLKAADLEATWKTNVLGPFLALQAVLPGMQRAKAGSVVLCSSVAGGVGLAQHEAIAVAKGGLEALVRASAQSYAAQGLRVNAVAPGLVATPLSQALRASEASLKASEAMHPLGRVGQPEEVAEAIAYLLGASWSTGVILPVDGGMAAGIPAPRRASGASA
jgi:NAD(P)-dependent dehydrogenase (short-subunit alcohol dehydrogenase family)